MGLAGGGLAACAALLMLLLALRIGVSVALPWWVGVLAPVIVYTVVAAVALAGMSLARKALGLVCLLGAHTLVALAGAVVSATASGLTIGEGLLEASARFLPAPFLLLCAVPLVLAPLRPLLERDLGRHGERAPGTDPRSESAPGWYAWPREEGRSGEPAGGGASPPPVEITLAAIAEAHRGRPSGLVMPSPPMAQPGPMPGSATPWRVEPSAMSREPAIAGDTPPAPTAPSARGIPLLPPRPASSTEAARLPITIAVEPPAPEPASAPRKPAFASVSPVSFGAMSSTATLTEPGCHPASQSDGVRQPAEAEPEPERAVLAQTAGPRDMIAIAFEHIAAQLPAEAFSVPLDRLGANLPEPGRLLVPRDIILPQLAEGEVAVAWDDIADQFPAQTLAVARHAVAERLPDRRLVLPLAEVFAQLPPDVFALGSFEVDVSGIQAFSLPFQPEPPSPAETAITTSAEVVSPAAPAEDAGAGAPAAESRAVTPAEEATAVIPTEEPGAVIPAEEPGAVVSVEATSAAVRAEESAIVPEQPALTPRSDDETGADISGGLIDDSLASGWTLAGSPDPPPEEASSVEPATAPQLEGSFSVERSDLADASEPGGLDRDGDRRTMRLLATRLAPIGGLEADVLTMDGVRLYAFLAPALPVETVMTLTAQVVGLLEPGRAPWPLDQLTLRLEDGAIVLTPLAAERGRRSMMVAAIRRGGSLAMLEILSKQEAVERLLAANGSPVPPVPKRDEDDMSLDHISAGPVQRHVAGTLGGLGRVVPTVFRGRADGLEISLFLDAGEDAVVIGRFAHRMCRALASDQILPGLGPIRSVVARTGQRRLVLMPVDEVPVGGALERWTVLLTAPAEPARPGLVRLHAERAAARLAAS
jgi:hypothetical protein